MAEPLGDEPRLDVWIGDVPPARTVEPDDAAVGDVGIAGRGTHARERRLDRHVLAGPRRVVDSGLRRSPVEKEDHLLRIADVGVVPVPVPVRAGVARARHSERDSPSRGGAEVGDRSRGPRGQVLLVRGREPVSWKVGGPQVDRSHGTGRRHCGADTSTIGGVGSGHSLKHPHVLDVGTALGVERRAPELELARPDAHRDPGARLDVAEVVSRDLDRRAVGRDDGDHHGPGAVVGRQRQPPHGAGHGDLPVGLADGDAHRPRECRRGDGFARGSGGR